MTPSKISRRPKPLWLKITGMLLIWLAGVTAITTISGGDFFAKMLEWLYFPILIFGWELVARGWKRRGGNSTHCAKCDYQQAPDGPPSERCPECGSYWAIPGGTVKGRLVRRRASFIAGISLVVLAFGSIFNFGFGMGRWTPRVLPVGSLIREIVEAPRGFVSDEWAALSRRSLSDEQRARLAAGLLEKRLRKGHLSDDGEAWFAGEIAAQRLAPDMAERFYSEMFDMWIDAPAAARVGDTINIGIGVEDRAARTKWYVCVEGYYIDDETTPRARQQRTISGLMLGKSRRRGDRKEGCAGGDYSPETYVTPEEPGSIRVRLVVWVVAGTRMGIFRRTNWLEDGEPEIPENAPWSRKIEITHTIKVIE